MVLRAGFLAVALKLQEAAAAMCHEDIRTRLSDALNDAYRGTGNWCYVVAVFGDDKSGDLVYSCSSDLKKAPYTISSTATKIDTLAAVDVAPLTTYEVQSDSLMEAGARNSKRDMVQLQTIHDSAAALGANCSMQEAHRTEPTGVRLVESAATLEPIVIREARADYEIKLIAPGKGSSAFYPAEVLKRDGPKVFKANTHVYVNHPTMAEEAQRPEGDVKNLAGVLTTDAVYHESHPKGEGLYARMKVFADHGQMVEEKAAHVGMSIRASGIAEASRKHEGLPVLKELTRAESVDVVTRAGAGGMILTEAAKPGIQTQEASGMDAAELQQLKEALAANQATNAKLMERALRSDAIAEGAMVLKPVTVPDSWKQLAIENVIERGLPKAADGSLEKTKLTEALNSEIQRVANAFGSQVRVQGMGVTTAVETAKPEDIATREAREQREFAEEVSIYESLGMSKRGAEFAAKGRAA